ncbi:GNAT family N-acetyltransferase [Patescibacteria group bacterium]|nr:GNAT family N-acetyltransferase [Patescibacteria group bacterium]
MRKEDLGIVAQLNKECFPEDNSTLTDAREWIEANWKAAPRTSYFVLIDEEGQVEGYILWLEKGGFRKEAVLELEQIAVIPSQRGRGGGRTLIQQTLPQLKERLALQGRTIKLIEVTTAADNEAQRLYRDTLGAEVEATIHDLFRGNEVIMVARNL